MYYFVFGVYSSSYNEFKLCYTAGGMRRAYLAFSKCYIKLGCRDDVSAKKHMSKMQYIITMQKKAGFLIVICCLFRQ